MRAMVVVVCVVDDDVDVEWSCVVDERGRKAGGRG